MSYGYGGLYIDSQMTALSALADQRAAINPAYSKAIIKAYAQAKLTRGRTRTEVGYKLDALEQELVAMRFPNFGAQLIAVRRELQLPPSRIYINASASAAHPSHPSAGTSGSLRRPATNNGYPGNVARTSSSVTAPSNAPVGPATTRRTARAPVQRPAEAAGDGASTPPPAYERMDPNPDADLIQAIMASLQMANEAPVDAMGVHSSEADGPSAPASAAPSASSSFAPPPLSTLPTDSQTPSANPTSQPQVGPEDPVRLLASYRTLILCDDSTSMTTAGRWQATQHILGALVDLAGQADTDVEVRFLNSDVAASGLCTRGAVLELFQQRGAPGGVTALGGRIEEVLLDYLAKLDQEREVLAALDPSDEVEKLKPLNLIVVTDGHFLKLIRHRPQHNPFVDPTSVPSDDPESVVVAAARRLDRGNWPLSQLGVFFLQIGDDGEAREALQELDDNLQRTYEIRDIVDTTHYAPVDLTGLSEPDGQLLRKVLLGGINRRIDRRD